MKVNTLNKDRKQKLEHRCENLIFESCIDLSEGVKISIIGHKNVISAEDYSKDIMSFTLWWSKMVYDDLNGFSGFHNIKFEKDFVIV